MTTDKTGVFEAAIPILAVADLAQAIDYYQHVLRFQVGWKWGEPPELANMYRDQIEVHLAQSADAAPAASRVYFRMTGVDVYFKQLTIAGAKLLLSVEDRPYGMRDFRIADPDGNELSFGERQ